MAKKKLLIAAVVVGALAAFLLFLYANQIQKQKDDLIGQQVEVVKAARDIEAGQVLDKNLIVPELVPEKFLPPNPIRYDQVDPFLGATLSVNVQEGSMILTSDFAQAEISRDLSSKIPEKERALSIEVDTVSGLSGLLAPGDRVDILGTFPVATESEQVRTAQGDKSTGYITMTLLQNVTLLAVGSRISNIVTEEQQNRGMYSTVTLSVTVEEAELLTIAQTRGKLMFLLRNRDDISIEPVTRRSLRQVLQDLELIQAKKQKRKPPKKIKKRGPIIIDGIGQ